MFLFTKQCLQMLASVSFAWAARRQGLYQEAIDILQATIFPFSEQNPPSSVYEYAETVQFHILLMRTSLEAGNLVRDFLFFYFLSYSAYLCIHLSLVSRQTKQ